jgi:hypothetical protein
VDQFRQWRTPAAGGPHFDVLLTADQNLEFQQNLAKLPMAVVVLVAPSNRLESLEPLVPALLETLKALPPKTLVRVDG